MNTIIHTNYELITIGGAVLLTVGLITMAILILAESYFQKH